MEVVTKRNEFDSIPYHSRQREAGKNKSYSDTAPSFGDLTEDPLPAVRVMLCWPTVLTLTLLL